ncbi:MAG: Flp pilus assembly complex ATPase component [bacterium]|nr:Flp pilus assembly complex ATPase component [bacterium]
MADLSALTQHLKRHLAGPVLDAFERDDVTDIHCNADGRVRFHTQRGLQVTDVTLSAESVRSVLHLLADDQGDSLSLGTAFFGGRFPAGEPFCRARIHAVLPPVTARPSFAIRVHAPEIFTLGDFASVGQSLAIVNQVLLKNLNVLIIGGTSTGKTSLLNSLVLLVAELFPKVRLLCLEDVPEITVSVDDHLCLQTEATGYTLQDLVANALRLNPGRLVIGEVRGGEALDLIDAWSTGHRGGFATLHADDVHGALLRLERLARRHPCSGSTSLRPDIASAVDVVIELRRASRKPMVAAIHRLDSRLSHSGEYLIEPITPEGED